MMQAKPLESRDALISVRKRSQRELPGPTSKLLTVKIIRNILDIFLKELD